MTSTPLGQPSILISGLKSWAELSPERVAVDDGVSSLTFSQLFDRVQTLGSLLVDRANSFSENRVLPILVDRSAESLIALLASMYAGIAFSPIDSEVPVERILNLLKRLKCEDILLATPNSRIDPQLNAYEVIMSNQENATIYASTSIAPDATGLVLFTSGSTGTPKGVVFTWSGFEEGVYKEESFPEEEHSLMRHGVTGPIHFSGGLVRQLSVSIGISVFIINPTGLTPEELLRKVRDLEITLFALPPSLIKSLGQFPTASDLFLPSVTRLEIGTEGLRYEALSQISRFFTNELSIFHGLGATEASCKIGQTFKLMDAPKSGQVPLGKPIVPGKAWLRPLAEEPSGNYEILFGADLAKEYLDDPVLTEERLILDENGTRWWRSGDLVSVDEADMYWHKGRMDDLVKIRGKLSSPSEVMNVLSQIKGISSYIVLPHVSGGSTRFIGHIVLASDNQLTARQVRRTLAMALPAHLVPAALVIHSELPLNLNRKVDRLKLLTEPVIPWRDTPFISARNSLENAVMSNVEIVLDLEELSMDDDIWEYGLDSLSAIELITRLESLASTRLTLDDLLTARTVEQIATRLKRTYAPSASVLSMNANGSRPGLFAIPGLGGVATHYAHLARALGDDQPLTVFPDVPLSVKDLSIESESVRISKIIEDAQPFGNINLAGFSAGGVLALEIARNLRKRNREVNILLIDAGIHHYSTGGTVETFIFDSAGNYARAHSRFNQKFTTLLGFFRSTNARKALSNVKDVFLKLYLMPKIHSALFFLSGGRLPRGVKRFDFLAARKERMRSSYVATTLDCRVTYFTVKDNPAPYVWQKLFPNMEIIEVQGDHVSMLKPPFVSGIAKVVRQKLEVSDYTPVAGRE